jgi:hypothetical protein
MVFERVFSLIQDCYVGEQCGLILCDNFSHDKQ